MSEHTKIEWATHTWSPWLGCCKVSEGCANCYITSTAPFRTRGIKHGGQRERTSESYWRQPLKWNKQAASEETAAFGIHAYSDPRVFPSLCDWLDDEVPVEWLADFLKLIHDTPNLDWLLLTKRPENWKPRLQRVWHEADSDSASGIAFDWLRGDCIPQNIWLGVSVENQAAADKRIPQLLDIPAQIRFLSCEPLLGPIAFRSVDVRNEPGGFDILNPLTGGMWGPRIACVESDRKIDWVIVGGESGPGARPFNVEWGRRLIADCKEANVACFVKQLGSSSLGEHPPRAYKHPKAGDWNEWPEDLCVREFPDFSLASNASHPSPSL